MALREKDLVVLVVGGRTTAAKAGRSSGDL
jgi:hypothetical protein